jgi:hypothetical protein
MKFSFKHYSLPTPNSLRILGNAIITVLGGISMPTILNSHPLLGAALIGLGIIGNYLSNCFTNSKKSE